jgi:hypothetical protein
MHSSIPGIGTMNNPGLNENEKKLVKRFIDHGIGTGVSQSPYTVSDHAKTAKLFDHDRLMSEISLEDARLAQGETLNAENYENLLNQYSSSFSASVTGNLPLGIGAVMLPSIGAEFKMSSNQTSYAQFCRVKKVAKYKELNLPDRPHRFLTNEASRRIEEVSDIESARSFVNDYGPAFIRKAWFGGVLVSSAVFSYESNSSQTSIDLEGALSTCINVPAGQVGVNLHLGINKGHLTDKSKQEFRYNVNAAGGDPAFILKGDDTAWVGTIEESPEIIDFSLSPISELAQNGEARSFLEKAVIEECHKAINKARQLVRRVFNGDYYISTTVGGIEWYLEAIHVGPFVRKSGMSTWARCCRRPTGFWQINQLNDGGHYIRTKGGAQQYPGWGLTSLLQPRTSKHIYWPPPWTKQGKLKRNAHDSCNDLRVYVTQDRNRWIRWDIIRCEGTGPEEYKIMTREGMETNVPARSSLTVIGLPSSVDIHCKPNSPRHHATHWKLRSV